MTTAYTSISFLNVASDKTDVLIAMLSEAGFEGFEEKESLLIAYIATSKFDAKWLIETATRLDVSYQLSEILPINWNAQWESNFEPVTLGSFLHIRASFHPPCLSTEHEIVITPKMSFGTGHHATTQLMVTEMGQLDVKQQDVFDFGTGTGVLAILAEKLGANRVLAIDNDSWSIENAQENIEANHCQHIQLKLSDTLPLTDRFSIIVANINLSILVEQLPALSRMLQPTGTLLLSGLLRSDQQAIELVCIELGLRVMAVRSLGDWIMLRLAY